MAKFDLNQFKALSFEEQLKLIESGDVSDAVVYKLPLDNAFNGRMESMAGNYFAIIDASDVNANINVEFNRQGSGSIPFTLGLEMVRPFGKFFITSDAQAGAYVTILISQLAPDLFSIQDNRSQSLQATYLASIVTNTNDIPDIKTATGYANPTRGTRVVKASSNATTGTPTVIHTVTAAKTFYLCGYSFNYSGTAAGEGASLYVTNNADVEQYKIINAAPGTAAIQMANNLCITPPIQIPAGYKIKIQGSNNGTAHAFIHGWEE